MTRIRFEDLPSTNTPRNAENLNKLNNVVISPTEPTTGEEVWIQKTDIDKKIYTKNNNGTYEEFYDETNREVHSTSEQRIGTWIDGKPLYEKTFVWEKTGYTGDVLTIDTVDISSLGVDTVFIDFSSSFIIDNFKGTVISPSSAGVPQQLYDHTTYIQNNKICVRGYNSKRVITLKYTKIAD
jgi:hypothetical protein